MASSIDVRNHLSEHPPDVFNKSNRCQHPVTGQLQIPSSTEDLMRWAPKFGHHSVLHWARMPIFKVEMHLDEEAFMSKRRPYAEGSFPEGEDLASAIVFWRKRVGQEGKGYAVFYGGFDTTPHVTEEPICAVDASTGEVRADSEEEIERKRLMHVKRRELEQRWADKGVPEELRLKMAAAESLNKERKQTTGEEFMLKAGWVHKDKVGLDVKRHNEIQKSFG
eukprot:CAMPEP_0194511202 /NCGR_PEP_ID=MMETSP0253-20130528/42805_1 /TAXON_ID=2966 /ORGANISM="Noctiluca scintillans" /LENGTH=221 /DNA_ID=CAMNT_0039354515 /DNA_START=12 /DNA_END=677 /DNA_ORIENTATION=+